jgi:hypothetical protein
MSEADILSAERAWNDRVIAGSRHGQELIADTFRPAGAPAAALHRCPPWHGRRARGLARMEAQAVLSALIRRVQRIHVEEPERHLNHGVGACPDLPVHQVELG